MKLEKEQIEAIPRDRYTSMAFFLCGYLSYPRERVEDVARLLRNDLNTTEPYILCTCKKCNTLVELEYFKGDDEDDTPAHFFCTKCHANYYDKKGQISLAESDEYEQYEEERRMERRMEDEGEDWW